MGGSTRGGRFDSRYGAWRLRSAPSASARRFSADVARAFGKTVPDIREKHGNQENLFPKFTTWRQQIDGQYWFPVYTKADDELHFKMEDVHIKEIVKYEDYKRFGSNVKILYQGKELPKDQQKPGQTPQQNPPQQNPPPPK